MEHIYIQGTLHGIATGIFLLMGPIDITICPPMGLLAFMGNLLAAGLLLGVFHWGGLRLDLTNKQKYMTGVFSIFVVLVMCLGLFWGILIYMDIAPCSLGILVVLSIIFGVTLLSSFSISTLSKLQELNGKFVKKYEEFGALAIFQDIMWIHMRILLLLSLLATDPALLRIFSR